MRVFGSIAGWGLLVLVVSGCETARTGTPRGGPRLSHVDSLVVQERESLYVGGMSDFALGSDGHLYIADRMFHRILVVAPDGKIERTIGRSGSGPGEFNTLGPIGLIGDTLLLAESMSHRRLNVFRLPEGLPVHTIGHEGLITSLTPGSRGLWAGNPDLGTEHLLGEILPESLVGDSTGVRSTLGELPPGHRSNRALFFTFSLAYGLDWGDTVLAGVGGSDTIEILLRSGEQVGRRVLPTRTRRGIPPGFVAAVDMSRRSFADIVQLSSTLFGLWRLPAGEIVVIHYDSELVGKNTILSRPYVSLLSPDLRRACMDTQIAVAGDVQPRIVVRGDTLFVLDQYAEPGGRSRVVLRKYSISTADCDWLPLESPESV